MSFWNRFMDDNMKETWLPPNQYLITNQVKEIAPKLLKLGLRKT